MKSLVALTVFMFVQPQIAEQPPQKTPVGQRVINLLAEPGWTTKRETKTDIAPGFNQVVLSRNNLSIYVDDFGKGSKCAIWLVVKNESANIYLNQYMSKDEVATVLAYINNKTKSKEEAEILKLLEDKR